LEKMVACSRKDWSDKLHNALWAYCTTYETPIGTRTTPFCLRHDTPYHLPIELEHKAYWAIKHLSFDLKAYRERRML